MRNQSAELSECLWSLGNCVFTEKEKIMKGKIHRKHEVKCCWMPGVMRDYGGT